MQLSNIHRNFAINLKSIMQSNKKIAFDKDEQELANLAKALAHPARIAILKELAKRQICICGEIVEVLPLAQSTVSQHLKELKDAEKGTEKKIIRGQGQRGSR